MTLLLPLLGTSIATSPAFRNPKKPEDFTDPFFLGRFFTALIIGDLIPVILTGF
jgi:hypothetical protein